MYRRYYWRDHGCGILDSTSCIPNTCLQRSEVDSEVSLVPTGRDERSKQGGGRAQNRGWLRYGAIAGSNNSIKHGQASIMRWQSRELYSFTASFSSAGNIAGQTTYLVGRSRVLMSDV